MSCWQIFTITISTIYHLLADKAGQHPIHSTGSGELCPDNKKDQINRQHKHLQVATHAHCDNPITDKYNAKAEDSSALELS